MMATAMKIDDDQPAPKDIAAFLTGFCSLLSVSYYPPRGLRITGTREMESTWNWSKSRLQEITPLLPSRITELIIIHGRVEAELGMPHELRLAVLSAFSQLRHLTIPLGTEAPNFRILQLHRPTNDTPSEQNCRWARDSLTRLPQGLRRLSVSGQLPWRPLPEDPCPMAHLNSLQHLRELHILEKQPWPRLEQVVPLTGKLEVLRLPLVLPAQGGNEEECLHTMLSGLTHLTSLHLLLSSPSWLLHRGITAFPNLASLITVKLELKRVDFTSSLWVDLGLLPGLLHLDINGFVMTHHLAEVPPGCFQHLRTLSLSVDREQPSCPILTDDWLFLGRLAGLEDLTLENWHMMVPEVVGNSGVVDPLSLFTSLRSLCLMALIKPLPKWGTWRENCGRCHPLSAWFQSFKDLQSLRLGVNVDNPLLLACLRHVSHLKGLALVGNQGLDLVEDETLVSLIGAHPGLTSLEIINNCMITDWGLKMVSSRLRKLEQVALVQCKDVGIKGLMALMNRVSLKSLTVHGCRRVTTQDLRCICQGANRHDIQLSDVWPRCHVG